MRINPIKTRVLTPPKDDLLKAMQKSLKEIPEKSVLVITSKVVSIWQGRCVPKNKYPHKDDLIKSEADKYIPRNLTPYRKVIHTLKNNLFIPSAGIDSSNANGHYILWPKDIKNAAKKIHSWIKKNYKVKNIGVIITDSHSIPLRRGVMGISLGHYGFRPLKDYRGTKDIFGRKLRYTQTNIVDSLAAAAVLVMGEGTEKTPLALITDIPFIDFSHPKKINNSPFSSLEVDQSEDLYQSLFTNISWEKGGGGI